MIERSIATDFYFGNRIDKSYIMINGIVALHQSQVAVFAQNNQVTGIQEQVLLEIGDVNSLDILLNGNIVGDVDKYTILGHGSV